MHSLGNDYVYVSTAEEPVRDPSALAIAMSRPHFGVHADGLVLIEPSDEADCAMRVFNADGSEAEMCGNAVRCVGKYLYERGLVRGTRVTVATRSGTRVLELAVRAGRVEEVTADLGAPVLAPARIPVRVDGDRACGVPVRALGRDWRVTCVNMGNPHAVLFIDDPKTVDVASIGPAIEHHELFPQRTNVEFVQVLRRDLLEMRVWERGSGETLACGTGAAAAVVAAVLDRLAERSVRVRLPGGELRVVWDAATGHVLQTGPASVVFDGIWPGA